MAAVDPYSTCPCGSGQKFKWCCHKVEAYADRSQRLLQNGQAELAMEALEEGLRKEPGNAWLLTRKSLIEIHAHQPEAAKASIRKVLDKSPKHAGGLVLMTRLVLETEGPSAGVAQLQQALSSFPPERRGDLAPLIKIVGLFLSEAAEFPAAVKHLRLAMAIHSGERDSALVAGLSSIEGNPAIPPWQKNPDELAPPPSGLAGEPRERFEQALQWAAAGLWSAAAASFETLSSDPAAGPLADRNLGFCRLWLADDAGGISALRRYVASQGATAEAVDIEALCQQIESPGPDDLVEHVQLSWPVRDRAALLAALETDRTIVSEGPASVDPDDPESPEFDQFALLDRERIEKATPELKVQDIAVVVGRVLVDRDTVILETYDDGRLDDLADRLTALAGTSLPPAHPRTRVVDQVSRLELVQTWEWQVPAGLDPEQRRRLNGEQRGDILRAVWLETPNRAFRGRTPLQASRAKDSEVALRAAICQFEVSRVDARNGFDFAGLRASLGIELEPAIDPDTVDIGRLHCARLARVAPDRLADDKLVHLYLRARTLAMEVAQEPAILAVIARPESLKKFNIDLLLPYTDIASIAVAHGQPEEAFEWIRRGRAAEPASACARNAPAWDIFEIKIKARTEGPESWVPEIAIVLDRYTGNRDATETVTMGLLDMGLIRMAPNPDHPGQILLDSRPLQALLEEYGPRVTTAGGRLGVSATKPEIWTPGSAAGGGGGNLWTPGAPAASPPAGGEKKLIFPGR